MSPFQRGLRTGKIPALNTAQSYKWGIQTERMTKGDTEHSIGLPFSLLPGCHEGELLCSITPSVPG